MPLTLKKQKYKIITLSSVFAICALDASSGELCNRDFSSMRSLIIGLLSENQGKTFYEDNKSVAYQDKKNSAIFLFTKNANPAHPAIACKMPIQDGSIYRIFSDIRCSANKDSCDAFAESVISLSEQQ